MQHDVVDSVLAAFSRQWIGRASPTVAGLSVVPLLGWDKPDAARLWRSPAARASDARGLSPAREVAPVVWSEAAPPHPRRLRARNLEGTVVVVDAGTVLDGGMSTRSVGATVVIPPRMWMTVAVEPVGARWWDEGPMRRAGRLTPVAAALMLQAALGAAPGASSARTAMWSLSEDALTGWTWDAELESAMRGWTLLDGNDLLAGWVAERNDAGTGDAGSVEPNADSAVVASLRKGLLQGRLEGHVLQTGIEIRDFAVFPRGLRLVDRVIAASSLSPPLPARSGPR